MRQWLQVISISVLCVILSSTSAWAEVKISATDTGWHIDASEEPLTGVLNAIAKHAGIKVSGTTKLVENPVLTGAYEGSLESILRRLLRGSDYAFETVTNTDGTSRITRLIVLSGIKGKAPSSRAISAARKLPASKQSAKNLTNEEKKQGARVTSLLTQKAQLSAGIQREAAAGQTQNDEQSSSGSGITRNADGSFDISPEAQARMAEATRRAQQDLQALTAAIRRNEGN